MKVEPSLWLYPKLAVIALCVAVVIGVGCQIRDYAKKM